MNHELRERAKNALGELKIAITKSVERLQSINYRKACEESLAALQGHLTLKWNKLKKNELKTNRLLQSAEPKGKNPALLVKNVPNEIDNNEIVNIIFDQNRDIFADGERSKDINLKFTLKKFPNTRHVVCELSPNLHQKCLSSVYLRFE
ncbi:hypothetical protein HNY73_009913 [Argiope bruennichi]|uniref:Uncharacterized protein n=1 Tax=Argiope bruennichi TaxID=94029 RepID=A0A8T0FDL9_ARGBR|nr:hypothetical protein HNY73_009913 [Argiope bruennichi]